jgi:hypothetical protein
MLAPHPLSSSLGGALQRALPWPSVFEVSFYRANTSIKKNLLSPQLEQVTRDQSLGSGQFLEIWPSASQLRHFSTFGFSQSRAICPSWPQLRQVLA